MMSLQRLLMKPKAWIFDIDGTLSLKGDRNPYEHDKSDKDEPCETVRAIYNALIKEYKIIIFTGRDEKHRELTENWLFWHGFTNYEILLMRTHKDERKDHIIKAEKYISKIEPNYDVIGVLDDRTRVVNMWRGMDLVCLQVRPGDF